MIMFLLVYLDSVSLATFVCLFSILLTSRFMVNKSYSLTVNVFVFEFL